MLVVLPNKEIPKMWDVFKDVLCSSIPQTPDMLPNWLTDSLYLALTGRIQLWLGYDPKMGKDYFYCAFVTKIVADELTGQMAMLIYAMKVFARSTRQTRNEDLQTIQKVCAAKGIRRITAFCLSQGSVNALKKAFPNLELAYFCSIPVIDPNFEVKSNGGEK